MFPMIARIGPRPFQAGSAANLITEILLFTETWEETIPSTPTLQFQETDILC